DRAQSVEGALEIARADVMGERSGRLGRLTVVEGEGEGAAGGVDEDVLDGAAGGRNDDARRVADVDRVVAGLAVDEGLSAEADDVDGVVAVARVERRGGAGGGALDRDGVLPVAEIEVDLLQTGVVDAARLSAATDHLRGRHAQARNRGGRD